MASRYFKIDEALHRQLTDAIVTKEAIAESANRDLRIAQKALSDARATAAGIAIGSVIFKDGLKYQVASFTIYGSDNNFWVSVYGNPLKLDGTFAKTTRYIGDNWTLAAPAVEGVA